MIAAVAAHGLPARVRPLPTSTVADEAWPALLAEAATERLVGLLSAAAQDGAVLLTGEQRAQLDEAQLAACHRAVLLERRLLDHADRLAGAGVAMRVLKGPALAHGAYPDPALRHFGDIDLLVPPGSFDAAVAAFREAGCSRASVPPRPGFDERFGKGACLVDRDGFELDLHRRFVFGPFGLAMDTSELFTESTPFPLGGRLLHGLGPEHRFLHACYHAALGDAVPRLAPLRDVAQLLLTAPLDTARVLEIAERWRGRAVVAAAVRTAWTRLGISSPGPLSAWAARYEPTTFERRSLRAYTGAGRSYAGEAVAGLRALPLGDRVAYAGALLLPQAQRGGRLRRLGKGVRLAAGLRRS